ncbi:MAG TPA: hypothetical protein VMD99_12330 [Terriglobales bacterium]|nr:hypothetical protein [Terriglobales bacterium]
MKLKLDRIISIATLVASLTAIILVLKRPAVVTPPQTPAIAAHTDSSAQKMAQQPAPSATPQAPKPWAVQASGQPPASASVTSGPAASANSNPAANLNSDAISAMLAKTLGAAAGGLSPDSDVGSGQPNIKDQQVTTDGDMVHGRFLTEIGGKDVWVTISGHMGEKDGYATFDPTEFKVGDMEVPVALVNPALQRKLAEERDRLKVPDIPQ